jgi:hypothetical protein
MIAVRFIQAKKTTAHLVFAYAPCLLCISAIMLIIQINGHPYNSAYFYIKKTDSQN